MHLVSTGGVAVAYEHVYATLMRTNILENVQAVYLRDLPVGTRTNLVITPAGTGGCYHVEWQGERAEVHDVRRATDTNTYFEGGYIITGKRGFGSFETVMNIRVQRTGVGQASFRVDALVYPHNGFIRFLFRNLLSVDDYFRDTMINMSAQFKRICTNLCLSNDVPTAATGPDQRQ